MRRRLVLLMIKIKIISVGSLKEKYFIDAAKEYEKRLSAFCGFEAIEISPERLSDNPTEKEIALALKKEAAVIQKKLPSGSLKVAMCIEGKQMPSERFSKLINEAAVNGKGCIVFLIGSSYGLDDELKKLCDIKMSMSEMTFPHKLARVMLTEQIYRAFKISGGGTYHK